MQQQTQPQAQSAGAATSPATLLASMQQLMGMQQLQQAAGTGQSYSEYKSIFNSLFQYNALFYFMIPLSVCLQPINMEFRIKISNKLVHFLLNKNISKKNYFDLI